jgi:predicted N-acetyltransferase YhbS
MPIEYRADRKLTPSEFVDLLQRSTLAERRPVDDAEAIKAMVEHASLMVTAWEDDRLVGVARSVTDFAYCCYLSDLAVDTAWQRQGIGRALIRQTQRQLAPACKLILLSAPAATGYYPKLGFARHDSAWIIRADQALA